MLDNFIQSIPQNPVFWAAVVASLIGLTAHYLAGGWIRGNYKHIKWFRRMFLPHITFLIHYFDLEDSLYVETEALPRQEVLRIDVSDKDHEKVIGEIEQFFRKDGWRPEVILASLQSTLDGSKEVSNWVLTAPEKRNKRDSKLAREYEIVRMATSEWQLHVRVFYDEEDEDLRFFVHHERNPYSPFYAFKHFRAKGMDAVKGRKLFLEKFPYVKFNGEVVYNE